MDNCDYEDLRDESTVKKRAQSVKSRLKELGHDLPLSHVYEALATMCGHRNWPTMKASFKSSTSHTDVSLQAARPLELRATMVFDTSSEPWVSVYKEGAGVELIYGPPGKGKTTLSNALLIERFKDQPAELRAALPKTVIIDLFGTSKPCIDLIKASLPEKQRSSVRHLKLRNDRSQSINVFDTPLGYRLPNYNQKHRLADFLVGLVPVSSDYSKIDSLHKLSRAIIDRTYLLFSDNASASKPKRYVAGNIAELDVAIASVVEAEGKELTWWEVVDALYEAMKVEHAVLAQRFAVPTLHDVMEMLSRDIAQTSQRDLTYQHMCDLVEAIKTHIASFPLKSEATDIPHFGRAQLFAIDHSEFLEHKHEADVRQISTAVLMSRLLATREMSIKVSDLYPPLYRSRYAHEEFLIRQKTPLLVFDDVHVLGASSAAMKQIAADCLNAARDRIIVRLSTQTFDQFKFVKGEIGLEAYVLNAVKTVFILGVNGREASFMSSQFNMPYDWVELCRHQLNGPKADGLDFVVCNAVDGTFHQAKLAVSPESIWETTLREDDIALVEIISAEIGRKRAVSRLARRFKHGTAAFEIDTRLRKQDPQGNVRAIIERIATEILMLG